MASSRRSEPDELMIVSERDLGIRGPNDPYAHGMVCMDCGSAFSVGDTYTHRQTSDDIFEVVCLGCAVLNPSEYQLDG